MKRKIAFIAKFAFLAYVRFFARLQLLKIRPTIIGVTGSTGKTSTLHAIAAVLKDTTSLRTTFHGNSQTGIPLHILGLSLPDYTLGSWFKVVLKAPLKLFTDWPKFQTYLIEMAIDSPNPPDNMEYLLSIIQPQIGVFLNAQAVHSQAYDHLVDKSVEDRLPQVIAAIAAEKGKMIESLPEGGAAILNLDDDNVATFIARTKAGVITFGYNPNATVNIVSLTPSLKGTWIKIKHHEQTGELIIPSIALPKSYGHSLAAAIAVGLYQNLTISQSIEALKKYLTFPPGRMNLIPGINQTTIIDSSYNASPVPMAESLEILAQVAPGRKLAVLGDMRELGMETSQAHELIAQKANDICDQVILVGPAMHTHAAPILGKKALLANDANQAATLAKSILQTGDTILIKGSQNQLFLEHTVMLLMKDPFQAKKLLCRQTPYWELERSKLGLNKS